jgi:hypothetical protein
VRLHIKNMVCNRCVMVVRNEMEQLGFDVKEVKLGEVWLEGELSAAEKERVRERMISLGFDLIDDRKSRIIERIKGIIIDLVHHKEGQTM